MRLGTLARPARLGVALCALAAASLPGARPAAAQDTTAVRAVNGGITVDFQDAELRVVITALAEAGRVNVVLGEVPPRRITLRLTQPVPRENILPLLRSLASSNGLTVTEDAGLLRVEAAPAGGAARPGGGGAPAAGAAQDSSDLRIFVYRLRHARAARMAATLQQLFGGLAAGGGTPIVPGISRRPLSERMRGEQSIAPIDPDSVRRADVARAQPPVVAPAPAAGAVPQGGLSARLVGDVQVVPEETTNSLLIRAEPADYQIIERAIQALDLRPLQVLIEVMIAEVRRTRDLDVGVSSGATRTRAGATAPDRGARVGNDTGLVSTAGELVLRFMSEGKVDVDVAIRALAARGDVRILSRPLILAQNNLEAKILVGSERPFVQVFRTLPDNNASRDQVVQYREVGTSLSILPTINPDGYVNLQVVQEVSSATSEAQFNAPVISTREASTHLFVRDGHTAVLGGLVDRQRERTRSGVPFLSDIPILGALFGSTSYGTINSELFLFLTPHIIRTDEEADQLRRELEERSDAVRKSPEITRPLLFPPAPGAPEPDRRRPPDDDDDERV